MELRPTGRHAGATDVSEPGDAPVPDPQPTVRVRVRRPGQRGPGPRFKEFLRRHKALSVIVLVALLLLAILIAWLLWLNHRLGDIDRFPLEPGGARPADIGNAENILLVGVDDPAGKGGLF